jgi:hypothetical protein
VVVAVSVAELPTSNDVEPGMTAMPATGTGPEELSQAVSVAATSMADRSRFITNASGKIVPRVAMGDRRARSASAISDAKLATPSEKRAESASGKTDATGSHGKKLVPAEVS